MPGALRVYRPQVPPPAPILPALVVEDDAGLRSYLVTALEQQGYRVLQAGSGEEALDLAANTALELAVLDVGLPGIDGFALADRLPRDVPLIIVTGDPVGAYAQAHERDLDYRVLPKPFSPELFEHAIGLPG